MDDERKAYHLSEILGCYEEWRDMPCTSLMTRMTSAIARAFIEDRKVAVQAMPNINDQLDDECPNCKSKLEMSGLRCPNDEKCGYLAIF